MATAFTSSFSQPYYLTSSFPKVTATTDRAKVSVVIYYVNEAQGSSTKIYEGAVYSYGSPRTVELADIGSIVANYFRSKDLSFGKVDIRFAEAHMTLAFLYCDFTQDSMFARTKQLLLASAAQRVYPDSSVAWATIPSDDASTAFTIRAVGHRADGSVAVVTKEETKDLINIRAEFVVQEIIDWARNLTDAETGDDLVDVTFFSIEAHGKQKLCYIIPQAPHLHFSFRNIFNIKEYIDIVGTMVTKTELSHDTAVCGGTAVQYDRSISRTYQVTTEPIPTEEVAMYEQFLTSHDISILADSRFTKAIITDHTAEPSNDDGSLTTFKFSWRFASERPYLFRSPLDGLLPPKGNVFNDVFSQEYD